MDSSFAIAQIPEQRLTELRGHLEGFARCVTGHLNDCGGRDTENLFIDHGRRVKRVVKVGVLRRKTATVAETVCDEVRGWNIGSYDDLNIDSAATRYYRYVYLLVDGSLAVTSASDQQALVPLAYADMPHALSCYTASTMIINRFILSSCRMQGWSEVVRLYRSM